MILNERIKELEGLLAKACTHISALEECVRAADDMRSYVCDGLATVEAYDAARERVKL